MSFPMNSIKRYAQRIRSFLLCSPHPPELAPQIPAVHDINARPAARLPVEVTERVSDFLFELRPPQPDSEGDGEFLSLKPAWETVSGFMSASMELHNMGYMRWIRVVTVKTPGDWATIIPDARLIRELRLMDETLISSVHKKILLKFSHLDAVTIDAHSDISHDGSNHFAYRDLVTAFPSSLRRLEITNAHGPDIKVIATVKKHCPGLEELRLGRCTIFNRANVCAFWSSFPFDHDSYISSEGTDEYTHSLSQELQPLKNLRSLRMGLYFVPSSIVLAHRLYHRRGVHAPEVIEWQEAIPLAQIPQSVETEPQQEPVQRDPATTAQLISLLHQPDPEMEFGPEHNCVLCTESTSQITEDTERSANAILSNLVPSLSRIEWMGWLTPKHLGVHRYVLK